MVEAFTPILRINGGGAFVNINSLATWAAGADAYNASKAALWSATHPLRVHLHAQWTRVLGVHVGPIDTDMAKPFNVPKNSPEFVARKVLDALEKGANKVLVDDYARDVKACSVAVMEAGDGRKAHL